MCDQRNMPIPNFILENGGKFKFGEAVQKIKGSQWRGNVCGFYSTTLTPEGYAVESDTEKGSVQIYPSAALCQQQPTPDDVRGKFEKWAERFFGAHRVKREGEGYHDYIVQCRWEGWLACSNHMG